jgi:hypothetical protein
MEKTEITRDLISRFTTENYLGSGSFSLGLRYPLELIGVYIGYTET